MAVILESPRFGRVNYGSAFNAPGLLGFVNETYFHQRFYRYIPGYDWTGATRAFKTTTVEEREGNMPMRLYHYNTYDGMPARDGITPKEIIPKCIIVEFVSGHMLNAVGLSGPGVKVLLEKGVWQKWPDPFVLSFMAVDEPVQHRLNQAEEYVSILLPELDRFCSPFILHANFGCPNVDLHNRDELFYEVRETLKILSRLGVPIVANFGPTVDTDLIANVAALETCTGLWLANTLPWDKIPLDIRIKLFNRYTSPLEKSLGKGKKGGLSGPLCLPFLLKQLQAVRQAGVTKPIIAGGGVQTIEAVRQVYNAGADGIALGAIGTVRPWRVKSIIEAINQHFGGEA